MTIKPTYHKSIHTLPIGFFMKVMETGDLKHLIIRGKVSPRKLQKAWTDIMNEKIKEFGVPDNYKKYLDLMSRACRYRANALDPNRRYEKAYAKIAEEEAKGLDSNQSVKFSSQISALSAKMGFRVNPNEVTVFEYYSYLNG